MRRHRHVRIVSKRDLRQRHAYVLRRLRVRHDVRRQVRARPRERLRNQLARLQLHEPAEMHDRRRHLSATARDDGNGPLLRTTDGCVLRRTMRNESSERLRAQQHQRQLRRRQRVRQQRDGRAWTGPTERNAWHVLHAYRYVRASPKLRTGAELLPATRRHQRLQRRLRRRHDMQRRYVLHSCSSVRWQRR